MRYSLSILLVLFVFSTSFGQSKRSGKVKRKYRNVEQVSQTLPPVFLRGEVYDSEKNPIAGASVSIDGTIKGVNTNENGEFLIENLVTGKARLRISFVGYKTKTIDYILGQGQNFYKIMLPQENIHIESVTVNAQKSCLLYTSPSPRD